MVKRLTVAACCIVLLTSVGTGRGEPLTLDWNAVWKLALEKNESIAAAKDAVARAGHLVGEAYAGALPTVNFQGAFQHYFEVPSSILHLPASMSPNNQPMRIKTQFGSENSVLLSLQLNQPLWVAGKIGLALEIAKRYRELSDLGVAVSRAELRLSLTKVFYSTLLAEEYLKVSREALAQAERLRNRTQALFDQGMVSEYDLIRARVAVANLQPQVVQAQSSLNSAYRALKNMIGIDVDREIVLEGSLKGGSEPPSDYRSAVRKALENRRELRQLDLQGELYERQFQIERRSVRLPNLFLGLKWESMAQSEDLDLKKYEFLSGWSGTISVQIPLFDGWASHHRAEKALVDLRSVRRKKTVLQRGIKLQVYQALSDYEKASKELEAAMETLHQAEKGLQIAEVRYDEGVGTQLEVLDAQLQVNRSRVNVLQARFNQLIARAEADRAIGDDSATE